jgi:hypothetical protein
VRVIFDTPLRCTVRGLSCSRQRNPAQVFSWHSMRETFLIAGHVQPIITVRFARRLAKGPSWLSRSLHGIQAHLYNHAPPISEAIKRFCAPPHPKESTATWPGSQSAQQNLSGPAIALRRSFENLAWFASGLNCGHWLIRQEGGLHSPDHVLHPKHTDASGAGFRTE